MEERGLGTELEKGKRVEEREEAGFWGRGFEGFLGFGRRAVFWSKDGRREGGWGLGFRVLPPG